MLAAPRPTSYDEFEGLLREARERQLRRRLLGAAGIAILAAIGLSVYALALGGKSGSTAVESPLVPPPVCRSSQLAGTAELNGTAGSVLGVVTIARTAGSSCSLPSRRPVLHIATAGRSVPVQQSPIGLMADLAPPLAHGAIAEIFLLWSNWCGAAPTSITLDFGGGVKVQAPLTDTQPPCRAPSAPSSVALSRPLTPG